MIEIGAVVLLVAWLMSRGRSTPDPLGPINPAIFGTGELPDEPVDPQVIDVLQPLVSATPRPGYFYQVVQGSPNAAGNNGLLAQALNAVAPGRGANPQLRLAYLDHMTRGWNATLYSRNVTTQGWPAMYNFRGINIGPAWLPRNANAVAEMVAGRMPPRTISEGGSKLGPGSSYGLLWLPDIEADELEQAAAIRIKERADGSDPYMPPPALLQLLEG
jgi:hypothetical protein